ncbi:US6NL [Enterospora canceri]|uniref:US6NL n=1 Tax=Enterospora canceri TaxID=1081671 RepID=A0A1Y1S3Q7_9MICR|nr:US6NL [Enterospora canceri]
MIKSLLGDLSGRLIGKRVIKNENEVDQETVRQIKADGTRTLANDYEGVEMDRLVELLMKYANHNTNVKYCQGMSDIAANVLKVFGVENDQTCFEVFSRLIELEMSSGDVDETGSIFDTRLSQMKSVMVKQKILIRKLDGNLYRILYTNETNPVGFVAFKWMLTYFTRFNGLRDRIWEYLIFYGFDILYYFTVAILKYHEVEIKQADEESLLLFLGDIESKYIEPNTVVNIVEEYMRHV